MSYWSDVTLGPDLLLLQGLASVLPPAVFLDTCLARFECAHAFAIDAPGQQPAHNQVRVLNFLFDGNFGATCSLIFSSIFGEHSLF